MRVKRITRTILTQLLPLSPCELWWIPEPAACPGWCEMCILVGTAPMAPHVAKAESFVPLLPDFQLPAVPEARGTLMSLPLTIAGAEGQLQVVFGFQDH